MPRECRHINELINSHAVRIAPARISSMSTIEIHQKSWGLRNKRPNLTAEKALGKTQIVFPIGVLWGPSVSVMASVFGDLPSAKVTPCAGASPKAARGANWLRLTG
jgi:hypothetical protein